MSTTTRMKLELGAVVDAALALAASGGSPASLDELEAKALDLRDRIRAAEVTEAHDAKVRMIGGYTTDGGPSLGEAIIEAGWELKTHPAVRVDHRYAIEMKAGSVDGGVTGAEVPRTFVSPALGLDQRYLFPKVRTEAVAPDATGVQSYRQLARSLADPGDMLRSIAETSTKPETDTSAEVVSEQLKQIATISTQTPNILLESDGFRSWVNSDLLAAFRLAVDTHIVDEIAGAGIPGGGGGTNVFEDVLYTQEVVRAAGYSPDLVVVSPGDALAIQLLVMSGGDSYAFRQALPSFVVTTAVDDGAGFVADASALGVLFLGSLSFATFEENSGSSNTSTVRCESSGLFLVQRPDAAATLAAS